MLIYYLMKKNSQKSYLKDIWFVLPPYLWMAIMLVMPHKEQRFLFIIYPMICLTSAIALVYLLYFLESFIEILPKFINKLLKFKLANFIATILIIISI